MDAKFWKLQQSIEDLSTILMETENIAVDLADQCDGHFEELNRLIGKIQTMREEARNLITLPIQVAITDEKAEEDRQADMADAQGL